MIIFILLALFVGLGAAGLEEDDCSREAAGSQNSSRPKITFSTPKSSARAMYQQEGIQLGENVVNSEIMRRQMAAPFGTFDVGIVLSTSVFVCALYCLYAFGVTDAAYVAALYVGARSY